MIKHRVDSGAAVKEPLFLQKWTEGYNWKRGGGEGVGNWGKVKGV